MTWDPTQYLRFGDERSRPFFELVDRIGLGPDAVTSVVDLGCGPGNLTETLTQRWPQAQVLGVDNDPAMLAAAADLATDRLTFARGDASTWRASDQFDVLDVLVSNATLQWVPGHLDLLPTLLSMVRRGGWFAFQVPGNLDDPHHRRIHELRAEPAWAAKPRLAAVPIRTHASFPATTYLDAIAPFAHHVDAWETSYVHVLHGDDPVLEWVKGTALRPVLAALDSDAERAEFCADLAPLLRESYPSRPWGTPFPFRRVFVVAKRA